MVKGKAGMGKGMPPKKMPMKDSDMGMMGSGKHMMPNMPPKGMGPEMSPLKPGSSKKVIQANIGELVKSGRPVKAAVAISYGKAGKSKKGKR